MENVFELAEYRSQIAFVAKKRDALFERLAIENRDPTPDEERELDALEEAIAFGKPQTPDDAQAQDAFASEIFELIESGVCEQRYVKLFNAAIESAGAFLCASRPSSSWSPRRHIRGGRNS